MTLRFAKDRSPADWLVSSAVPWQQLVTFGPGGFPAYARLRYIADPVEPSQSESDVDVAQDHPTDLEQARRALGVLEAFTTTSDSCYFCVWDGYKLLPFPPELTPRPWIDVPHRRYAVLQGQLRDIDEWDTLLDNGLPPAFVWPADHSWVFTSDVDPHWAGIAAARAALAALFADSVLEVVEADPSEQQPSYY